MDSLPKIIAAALAMTTIAELKTIGGEPHAPQEGQLLDPPIGKMAMEALVSGQDVKIRPDSGIYKTFPRGDTPKK